MLKLKLQYFGHLMWRTDSLELTLMLGKIEGGRRRGQQRWDGWMASLTQWTWVWASFSSWWWTGKPGVLQSMGCKESDKTEWLNWGHKNIILPIYDFGEREVECVTFLPSETFKRAGWLAFHRFCSLSSEWWESCIPDWDQSIETGFPTSPVNLILLSCF